MVSAKAMTKYRVIKHSFPDNPYIYAVFHVFTKTLIINTSAYHDANIIQMMFKKPER